GRHPDGAARADPEAGGRAARLLPVRREVPRAARPREAPRHVRELLSRIPRRAQPGGGMRAPNPLRSLEGLRRLRTRGRGLVTGAARPEPYAGLPRPLLRRLVDP